MNDQTNKENISLIRYQVNGAIFLVKFLIYLLTTASPVIIIFALVMLLAHISDTNTKKVKTKELAAIMKERPIYTGGQKCPKCDQNNYIIKFRHVWGQNCIVLGCLSCKYNIRWGRVQERWIFKAKPKESI